MGLLILLAFFVFLFVVMMTALDSVHEARERDCE